MATKISEVGYWSGKKDGVKSCNVRKGILPVHAKRRVKGQVYTSCCPNQSYTTTRPLIAKKV